MSETDIDKMEAGRELDMLVAEKVMGWVWCFQAHGDITRPGIYDYTRFLAPPDWAKRWRDICRGDYSAMPIEKQPRHAMDYSTDIAAAWKVVEKLREMGFSKWAIEDGVHYAWEVYIENSGMRKGFGTADTFPMAICRAALKALAAEQQPEPEQPN